MKITTQDTFIDHQIIETLGIVKGNTIRARHIGKDILAGFRSIVGGEVSEYTKMLAESREQAIDRMIEDAKSKVPPDWLPFPNRIPLPSSMFF